MSLFLLDITGLFSSSIS